MATVAAAQGRKPQTLRIIVADDNRDAAVSLAMVLRDEGHEVLEAYRGDAVLQLATRFQPHVMILDIGMPGLTGFEIAHALRLTLGTACPVLIAVTAWNQPAARELGKASGFSHYLTKPCSTETLLNIIASLPNRGPAQ
jgi:CheY-like chemotaxis protein